MTPGLTRSSSFGSLSGLTSGIASGLSRTPSTSSLTNAFKRLSSGNLGGLPGAGTGLHGAKDANTNECQMQEEVGDWKYLIIDPKGMRPRPDPNYSKEKIASARYNEGAVVEVDRRRKTGWTTFLGVRGCHSQWLFDVSPKDKKVRAIQVEVKTGEWHYEACAFDRVAVLPHPAAKPPKTTAKAASSFLEMREVVAVTKRVRPVSGKGSYLKLADGRGWVLDFADGHRMMQPWTSDGGYADLAEQSTSTSASSSTGIASLSEADLSPPEIGEWEYVVLDHRGMALRSKPTYDPSHKTERRIHEGEIVVVKERRAGDGITFLRLDCPQGWVFDRQPGKDSRIRMMEVNMERGVWHYIVSADSGIALRTRCSFSEDTKCGKGPLKGALIEVCQRVRIGETTFLQLKEGGRWVFDSRSGRKMLVGPMYFREQAPGTVASVREPEGISLLCSPTKQKWAVTKMRLLHNSKVEVSRILEAESVPWGFVSKPGSGMEGWVKMHDLTLEENTSNTPGTRPTSAGSFPQAFA